MLGDLLPAENVGAVAKVNKTVNAEFTVALPDLVQRAADALLSAKTSAEVLDARDKASVAYTAAKAAGRMAKAKTAHDTILAEVYRAQADALLIEARAKMRLADEYDAAQDRGEVAGHGRSKVEADNLTTTADLGLRRDEIHEARQHRDFERDNPGAMEAALDEMLSEGQEPTKAKLKRAFKTEKPARQIDPKALWLWGRLKDFERDGVLRTDIDHLLDEMTPPMREDVTRLAPLVAAFLEKI
jgi:hypothetical protein